MESRYELDNKITGNRSFVRLNQSYLDCNDLLPRTRVSNRSIVIVDDLPVHDTHGNLIIFSMGESNAKRRVGRSFYYYQSRILNAIRGIKKTVKHACVDIDEISRVARDNGMFVVRAGHYITAAVVAMCHAKVRVFITDKEFMFAWVTRYFDAKMTSAGNQHGTASAAVIAMLDTCASLVKPLPLGADLLSFFVSRGAVPDRDILKNVFHGSNNYTGYVHRASAVPGADKPPMKWICGNDALSQQLSLMASRNTYDNTQLFLPTGSAPATSVYMHLLHVQLDSGHEKWTHGDNNAYLWTWDTETRYWLTGALQTRFECLVNFAVKCTMVDMCVAPCDTVVAKKVKVKQIKARRRRCIVPRAPDACFGAQPPAEPVPLLQDIHITARVENDKRRTRENSEDVQMQPCAVRRRLSEPGDTFGALALSPGFDISDFDAGLPEHAFDFAPSFVSSVGAYGSDAETDHETEPAPETEPAFTPLTVDATPVNNENIGRKLDVFSASVDFSAASARFSGAYLKEPSLNCTEQCDFSVICARPSVVFPVYSGNVIFRYTFR